MVDGDRGDEKKQFNVYLNERLVREVKFLALDRQQSLSDFVREALEAHIKNVGKRKRNHN